MMELHDLGANSRLESAIIVGEVGERDGLQSTSAEDFGFAPET